MVVTPNNSVSYFLDFQTKTGLSRNAIRHSTLIRKLDFPRPFKNNFLLSIYPVSNIFQRRSPQSKRLQLQRHHEESQVDIKLCPRLSLPLQVSII